MKKTRSSCLKKPRSVNPQKRTNSFMFYF